MPPDLAGPVALLFVFAIIGCTAGIYYFGEQWFLELEEKARRDEERGE